MPNAFFENNDNQVLRILDLYYISKESIKLRCRVKSWSQKLKRANFIKKNNTYKIETLCFSYKKLGIVLKFFTSNCIQIYYG